ncbi:c966836d-6d64-4a29-b56e-9d332b6b971a [Thermothielavioides terrestris]|uniref:non-specific serine/threonine protein kinase n=1 Tax=Thermothielavioides terrestris TaxID=2587410 RepID=A0A446BMW9_9PEZI|nr:c966836d-6d64-4a29-b56e-9d332b6b971a [Thermothielavioides terrestris]
MAHPGRYPSRTPEADLPSRDPVGGPRRRSRSPRGWKRPRDDRRDRRDPRQFRVHYEDGSRDGRRHYRDLDRPPSRGSDRYYDHANGHYGSREPPPHRARPHPPDGPGYDRRGYERDRRDDGHADKRPRNRSRSPPSRPDRGRRDRGRDGADLRPGEDKYSAQAERRSQDGSTSKRATPVEAPGASTQQDAKNEQGATVERGIHDLAISQTSAPAKDPEPDMDWDPDTAMDEEAAVQAEIERRRRAREAALKRGLGAASPAMQALQAGDRPAATPTSTRQSTPGVQRADGETPQSNGPSSPPLSPGKIQDALSPGAFNFADDQALINAHGDAKARDEDGPSAADYDPTVDMREDERRDELRHGNLGLHGEPRDESLVSAAPEKKEDESPQKKIEDDDDFDMFAEDFAEKYAAPVAPKSDAAQEARAPGGGGGILEGDDKEGYYKIRPGELLDGRYQVSTTLGRGMFSGVARAVDMTTKKLVAIKIMRKNDALRKGGFTEIAILEKLNGADPDDKKHIVRFERSFEYKGHLCMAFENLSMSLREVLKKFGNNVGINLGATRAYAYQIFLALGHMRKCSIIHADLKPDNILVNEARNVLKICDLGTAIDRSDAAMAATEPMPYLVSRFYRAPEIILGVPFDYAVDMWSIGCTLYELYTGKILFTGENNNQMLKNIMEIRGKLSAKLYRRGELAHNHFDEMGNFISVERDKILGKTTIKTLATVKPTRDLRTRLLAASAGMSDAEGRELNHFVDLLERCLTLNPDKRITPAEALRHPFFTHRVHGYGQGQGHGHGLGQGQGFGYGSGR